MPGTKRGKYETEAAKLFQLGDDFWREHDYDEARTSYEKAIGAYSQTEDVEGESFALARLGELELSLDNYDRALMALDSALEVIKNESDLENTRGDIFLKLSKVFLAKGDNGKALTMVNSAQKIFDAVGNSNALGDAYDQEAYIHMTQNKEKEALEAYKKAAMSFKVGFISLKEAASLRAIARLQMKNKNYDEAHDILERCRKLYRENGDLLGEASVLSAIGTLRFIIKDIENSRKALMKSVYLYGKAAHHFAEAEALLYLARVEASDKELGDYERARAHYKRSIDLFSFLNNEVMKEAVLQEYHNFLARI